MKLLLHICCGPCAIMPTVILKDEGWEITGFFHNPNIHPLMEYLRRREGAEQYAAKLQVPLRYDDAAWDLPQWLKMQWPPSPEKKRCELCIGQRMLATVQLAAAAGTTAFSTTLLYSRYQPHDYIKATGEKLAKSYGIDFIYKDFRQYWQEGIDHSKDWQLYRQPYCGCIFSEAERYARKLAKCTASGNPLQTPRPVIAMSD